MKLKGNYDGSASYSVGDVVRYTDNVVYVLQKQPAAGATPMDSRYWGRVQQPLADAILMVLDGVDIANSDDVKLEDDLTQSTAGKKALDAHQGKVLKGQIDTVSEAVGALVIPDNISSTSILLNSSSSGSTKQFLLTIADPAEGEDPELTITELVPDGGGES